MPTAQSTPTALTTPTTSPARDPAAYYRPVPLSLSERNEIARTARRLRDNGSILLTSGFVIALTLWGADAPPLFSFASIVVGVLTDLAFCMLAFATERKNRAF